MSSWWQLFELCWGSVITLGLPSVKENVKALRYCHRYITNPGPSPAMGSTNADPCAQEESHWSQQDSRSTPIHPSTGVEWILAQLLYSTVVGKNAWPVQRERLTPQPPLIANTFSSSQLRLLNTGVRALTTEESCSSPVMDKVLEWSSPYSPSLSLVPNFFHTESPWNSPSSYLGPTRLPFSSKRRTGWSYYPDTCWVTTPKSRNTSLSIQVHGGNGYCIY